MDKNRRPAPPNWNDLERSLAGELKKFLPAHVSIALHELPRSGDCRILRATLGGPALTQLAAEFGGDGKMDLYWLLPVEPNLFADAATGELWTSARVLILEGFFAESDGEATGNTSAPRGKADLTPDLDHGRVVEGWWADAERLWRQFARAAEADRVSLQDFVRLEAGLNALWTSARKRSRLLTKIGEPHRENPLLRTETQRQIRIGLWGMESHGRLRLPHESHKGRLCPFQTPESKRTGLDLHLAAGAEVTADGTIRAGDYLFSIAVGMIPYPLHTDGPRLMMGGKNMKQAEIGIEGAEPPIVPGYLEGERAQFIPALKELVDKKGRLTPSIGLNALTVVMPFEGYTYEDGLVVSQSLAQRFFIGDGTHTIHKTYERWLKGPCLADPDPAAAIRSSIPTAAPRYVYGDPLPLPRFPFHLRDKDGKLEHCPIPTVVYDHHAPGTLNGDAPRIEVLALRPTGKDEERGVRITLKLTWRFRVERPLGLGDKLTGRHGNKGVVTRILPDKDMPRVRMDGEELPAELIISPSSIMGRKNLGQLLEMAHSVLLRRNVPGIPDWDELDETQRRDLTALMQSVGADEWGAFPVSLPGQEPREVRAFAGWQYFCRLHHHAVKKLQARGASGPFQEATGQPAVCGARTGQRLGEMENWSLLSHGAEDVLFKMREDFTGDPSRTKDLMRRIFRSLNLELAEQETPEGGKKRGPEKRPCLAIKRLTKAAEKTLDLRELLKLDLTIGNKEGVSVRYRNGKPDISIAEELGQLVSAMRKVERESGTSERRGERKRGAGIDELKAMLDGQGNLYVEPELLSLLPDLKRSLGKFLHATHDEDKLEALVEYRTQLVTLLSGKNGVPRRHLLGRRYNHSGRAVIVPCPDLDPHEVRLPLAMLVELLDGYGDDVFGDIFSEPLGPLRTLVNDPGRKKWSDAEAERCDKKLRTEKYELWGFLVRQPSLHRHSIQAFRLRCWNEPVIGLPPFVTAGFNADFDGDTMAVFLPPVGSVHLEKFSILSNPGLVGTGAPAFATGLDLALGWWNMDETERKKLFDRILQGKTGLEGPQRLGTCLPMFLLKGASLGFLQYSALLGDLQKAVCSASTGAATLTPLEFQRLSDCLEALPRQRGNETAADRTIKDFLERYPHLGLARMVASGAKGKVEDVRQMTWAVGSIAKFEEASENPYLTGNFWNGLEEDEMFLYSYPSRDSMAQKKLAVAEAGYLSRQFAEGLYELRVQGGDCGTRLGLRVGYAKGQDGEHLTLSLGGEELVLPTLGQIEEDLERVAWGRSLAGEVPFRRCLDTADLRSVLACWRGGAPSDNALQRHLEANENHLILRSPLFCSCASNESVCARCCGADLTQKPLDTPKPVEEGVFVGLTAAQAIGERGTQLAMKRFHDVGGTKENRISRLRECFIAKQASTDLLQERFASFLETLSTGGEGKCIAFSELPQSLIHYELALRRSHPMGLDAEASRIEGRYLSALAHERIRPLLLPEKSDAHFTDSFDTVKSRLLWGGSGSDFQAVKNPWPHRSGGKEEKDNAATEF